MIGITFGGTSLQTGNIICSGIQHEDIGQKSLNIQKFALREGGKFVSANFDVKKITLTGHIKGTSQANLESRIDDFKKLLNKKEKDLDVEYNSGTRRYKATMTQLTFDRKHYTIDYINWEAVFTVSNPPLGKSIDTSTLEDLSNSASAATTTTGLVDGFADYSGTFRPRPIVKITFNTVNGFRRLDFNTTDEDGYLSRTRVQDQKLYNGDVITIDVERSEVALNGTPIDYIYGLPHFSLTGNVYDLKILAKAFNVDLKIIYTPFWL